MTASISLGLTLLAFLVLALVLFGLISRLTGRNRHVRPLDGGPGGYLWVGSDSGSSGCDGGSAGCDGGGGSC